MDREILVSLDLHGAVAFVGRLWCRTRRGRHSASFEYDPGWLAHPEHFALEPALMLASGPFHTAPGRSLFGAVGDSMPDRWGRLLMRRAERRRARQEGRATRALSEADVLLLVDDEARQGALRFSTDAAGPFLAEAGHARIPPFVELPRLLASADRFAANTEGDEDLRLLLGPGSSLGGARPKVAVRDADGRLAIAKFPHAHDDVNVVLWEAVALALAENGGIEAPERRLETIAGRHVLIVRRFDRRAGRRVPFLSAMSMLGAAEREAHSYLEIADALRRHGARPRRDLRQLWRRIVFNVLISNVDDHLRNHGFLYADHRGWRLSPVYDLNPVPVDIQPRVLSTAIDADDPSASVELALATVESYGLEMNEAKSIAQQVAASVTQWREVAAGLGAARRDIDRMASAFEHDDLYAALRF